MKKLMFAAVGLTGILAACGSAGVAPDGSGSARVIGVTTEYAIDGQTAFVGCDEITNPTTATRARSTQVIVKFATAGEITDVTVKVRGLNSSQYDQTQSIGKPTKDADGNYKAIFDFNSATGQLLPNSIVVSPKELPVKKVNVNTGDKVPGGFYADLTLKTSTGSSFTITSKNLGVTPVYRKCTLANTAQPLSQ
ncbi:hypothetical protein GCM10008959_29740 [Deinococcus seoulensis]|uniref:DUF4382 domain-containing protein n=2 Tax=Deinococcus TaxID=1298 RepID=A0ABQ2RTI6_9DEIO|nr:MULTISPECIES: hypothetical protein [Deinococcus]GGR65508.1 hypothetical protein GCM10008959_29740 [Deinococcus seoulensis]GGS13913.1 hypothetical protein GCM10008961_01410 [Deinococcus knuensis]